jgi:hypothetical protein
MRRWTLITLAVLLVVLLVAATWQAVLLVRHDPLPTPFSPISPRSSSG